MKIALLLLLACGSAVLAEVPRKQPVTRYSKLWNDSPFTSKPLASGPAEEVNPFENYTLAGVSPIAGGYRVTLLDKKQPDQRTYLESGTNNPEGFKILEVSRKPDDPLATTVRIGKGTLVGIVTFDDKLLALKAGPIQQAPARPGRPGIIQNNPNGAPVPGQPAGSPLPQRQPRPRIIPPPGVTTSAPAADAPIIPAPAPQNLNTANPEGEEEAEQDTSTRRREFRRR